jgi:isoleucyl-tRNA synthetase
VRQSKELSADRAFTLHDGPPYANGNLHIGHALNKILKDITCRVQLLEGRRVKYVPGWDCHGLPIELKALQKQKEAGKIDNASQLGAIAVRQAARALAHDTVEAQKAGFQAWGVMGEWDKAWRSMDKDFEMRQLDVFKSMLSKGLIYQNFKPVYWSPSSQTALAEAELEYNSEHQSTAVYVKFPMSKLPSSLESLAAGEPVSAVIWTTTPWTLLANKAIGVHESLEYALTRSASHGLLLIAKSQLDEVYKTCGEEAAAEIMGTVKGRELTAATYKHPAFDGAGYEQPIFHGDFVSADSGSGLVHMAPGHGMEDYKLCLKNDIAPFAPVDDQGRFTDEAYPPQPELFAGREVLYDGNRAVLKFLSDRGAVISSNKYRHNYPYDWRSKQPVITRATRQWFANVGETEETALKALDDVRFIPAAGEVRLSSFVKNRSEWCISRQRAWGVPIPALYEEVSGSAVLTPESVSHVISVIEQRGIDSWWTDDEFDDAWVPSEIRGKSRYRRGRDTMDVWFDSGTSWTHMSKDPDNHAQVADVYIEGSDQHRGWFQSSLLTKIAVQAANGVARPVAPFKTLITHGFTLDQVGKKMSKSLGNTVSPDEIMQGTLLAPIKRKKQKGQDTKNQPVSYDGMGPDALRLWVAGCDYTKDVVVGIPVLKAVNGSLAKMRVTFKLLTGLLDTHNPELSRPFDTLSLIDQMALIDLQRLTHSVRASYAKFDYHQAMAAINQYINTDLSAVYIESIKDRLYADDIHSASRTNAQLVLWQIFTHLTRLLAPVTPLLVEEVREYLPAQLFNAGSAPPWESPAPQVTGIWTNAALEQWLPSFSTLNVAVKAAQEHARSEKKMGSSLQSEVLIRCEGALKTLLTGAEGEEYRDFLLDLFVVSDLEVTDADANAPQQLQGGEEDGWRYTEKYSVKEDGRECEVLVTVHQPRKAKCVRCWKYTVESAHEDTEEHVCQRCVDVVADMEAAA